MGDSKMALYVSHDAMHQRRTEIETYTPRLILDIFDGGRGQPRTVVGVAGSGNEIEIALCLPPGEFRLPSMTEDNLASVVDVVATLGPSVVGVIVDRFTGIHLAAALGAAGLVVAPLLPDQVRCETKSRSLDIGRIIAKSGMTGRRIGQSAMERVKTALAARPAEDWFPVLWRQEVAAAAAVAFNVASWPGSSNAD